MFQGHECTCQDASASTTTPSQDLKLGAFASTLHDEVCPLACSYRLKTYQNIPLAQLRTCSAQDAHSCFFDLNLMFHIEEIDET